MSNCKRCGKFTKKHRSICKKCLPQQCDLCRRFMVTNISTVSYCGKPCTFSMLLDKALNKMRKKIEKHLFKPSPFFKLLSHQENMGCIAKGTRVKIPYKYVSFTIGGTQ